MAYQYCTENNCPSYANDALFKIVYSSYDGARSTSYYDILGREVASSHLGYDGYKIIVTKTYDNQGRLLSVSPPYCIVAGCDAPIFTNYSYLDDKNKITVNYPDGSVDTTYQIGTGAGTKIEVEKQVKRDESDGSVSLGKTIKTVQYKDVRDLVVKVEETKDDASKVTTSMAYDVNKRLIWTKVSGAAGESSITQVYYDDNNATQTLDDPDTGKTITTYDALGNLVKQVEKGLVDVENKARVSESKYDALNRLVEETNGTKKANWFYDNDEKGVGCGAGRLCAVTDDLTLQRYTYSKSSGLPEQSYTYLGSNKLAVPQTFSFDYSYDTSGRLAKTVYPSGLITENHYKHGYLSSVQEITEAGKKNLWKAQNYNVFGALTEQELGNGLQIKNAYDYMGRLRGITSGVGTVTDTADIVMAKSYGYDSLGNLAYRKDLLSHSVETFQYDKLNRLILRNLNNASTSTVSNYHYSDLGNLKQKGSVTDYKYADYSDVNACKGADFVKPGPHAVREASGNVFCYDLFGNQLTDGHRKVTYNHLNKPLFIKKGDVTYTYQYGPDGARYYQRKEVNGKVSETYYLNGGSYEKDIDEGVVTLKAYVSDFLIDKRQGGTVTQTYTLRDNLGSIDTIVDADVTDDLQASVVERMFYAPFGERELDGRNKSTITPVTDDRGFTDHEHMDDVGLIHMNGRVYDPVIGRFLSADPYVQSPFSSQSYNRYSYG